MTVPRQNQTPAEDRERMLLAAARDVVVEHQTGGDLVGAIAALDAAAHRYDAGAADAGASSSVPAPAWPMTFADKRSFVAWQVAVDASETMKGWREWAATNWDDEDDNNDEG